MTAPYCSVEGCHDTRTHTYAPRPGGGRRVDYPEDNGRRLCWVHALHEFHGYSWDESDGDGPSPLPWRVRHRLDSSWTDGDQRRLDPPF